MISRRNFLQAIGLTATSVAFPTSLWTPTPTREQTPQEEWWIIIYQVKPGHTRTAHLPAEYVIQELGIDKPDVRTINTVSDDFKIILQKADI